MPTAPGPQGFSKLKPRPGSEIFTKFADVKSRIGWTAERRQLLQEMWDRGDKAPAIAAALGCKVGAVNVARARFGLKPRRDSVRAAEGAGRAGAQDRARGLHHFAADGVLHREGAGRADRARGPQMAARHRQGAGRQRHRRLRGSRESRRSSRSRSRPASAAKPTRIVVEDNGPGIPAETIAGIIDYNIRISSREAYISPTRGRQGNALKTILPMAYVLGGKVKGETWIEARGRKHRIMFTVNQIKQEPIVEQHHEPFPGHDRDAGHGVLAGHRRGRDRRR